MRSTAVAAILLIVLAVMDAFAQAQQSSQSDMDSNGGVILVTLSQPGYPVIARLSNVTGDVEVKLTLRSDGTVESASVMRGSPMLTQAALESARQSRFECQGCEQGLIAYSLIYSFQLVASPDFPCPAGNRLRVSQAGNHVTVSAEPALVHPYFLNIKSRSVKCLYLWNCGSRWGGTDYYFYRVRSPKCLDLWNCGRRLREPFATCKKLHRQLAY